MSGDKAQPPLLCDRGQHQYALHPGERFTNTLTVTASKRKINKFWKRRFACGREALWIKLHWIREVARVSMSEELAGKNSCSRRQVIRAKIEISSRLTPPRPGWRVEPHTLGENHF